MDPSFVIGGEISEVGSNAHHGTGEHFVAEADEHDRSFLHYRPYVSIVTNIDSDHLNTYGDLAGLDNDDPKPKVVGQRHHLADVLQPLLLGLGGVEAAAQRTAQRRQFEAVTPQQVAKLAAAGL